MIVVVFLLAIVVGFLAAVPVGGSQLELIRRCLAGFEREAMIMVCGCATADIAYGMLALFGLAPFLEQVWVSNTLRIAGGIVMMVIGYQTIRESRVDMIAQADNPVKAVKPGVWQSYSMGFMFSGTNPMIVVAWLLAFKILHDIGFDSPDRTSADFVFVVGAVGGMATYLFTLTRVVRRLHKFLVPKKVQLVIKTCGILLMLAGAVVFGKTVTSLF